MTRPRLLALLPVLLLGLFGVLAGCGSTATGDKGYIAGEGVINQLPAAKRKAPGPVEGESLDGRHLSLEAERGKVVVVNVWGSWCPPCRAEAEYLVEAAEHFEGQDVEFVGVNIRDSVDAALAFEQRYGIAYPSFNDASGAIALQFIDYDISPTTIPATFVIDRERRIFSVWREEFKDAETLIADIDQVLES